MCSYLLIARWQWTGAHLGEDDGMHQQKNHEIHHIKQFEGDIDEHTFIDWKNELKKNLPTFWRSMQ